MNEVPGVLSELKVAVRYVGVKEVKYDNVCHTRTIWRGEGDEQLVPIAVAAQLARFPKVWEVVREEGDATGGSLAPEPRPILRLPKKKA